MRIIRVLCRVRFSYAGSGVVYWGERIFRRVSPKFPYVRPVRITLRRRPVREEASPHHWRGICVPQSLSGTRNHYFAAEKPNEKRKICFTSEDGPLQTEDSKGRRGRQAVFRVLPREGGTVVNYTRAGAPGGCDRSGILSSNLRW